MDSIILKQKIGKWNEACQFLKNKQEELSTEEWTAIEVLADLWRQASFNNETTETCNSLIEVLVNSDKLHSNNKDIIVWSKEFRGIAQMMYTKDKETFLEFQKALQKLYGTRPRTVQTSERRQSPIIEQIATPSIQITKVEFCNTDVNSTILQPVGSIIYTDFSYLTPQITYRVLKTGTSIDIWYKIYSPSGILLTAESSKSGFTWKGNITRNSIATFISLLGGFGNKEKKTFSESGIWRIEFFEGDILLYEQKFSVNRLPSVPTPPIVTRPVAPSRSYQTPPRPHYPRARQKNRWPIITLAIVLCLIIGFCGYKYAYIPYAIDRDAPRFYTFTNLNLRSSEIGDVEYNLIKTLPYGSELITYSQNEEWASVKANGSKGFVSSQLLLPAQDFHLLNSTWGNTDSKECVMTAKCRLALLDYFKRANLQGGTEWQIYTKNKDNKTNTVYYPRLFDKNSKFTDFLFILKNNQTKKRMLAFYSFDNESEKPIFRHDLEAPIEGYIIGATSYWTQSGLQISIAFSTGEYKRALIKAERTASVATSPKELTRIRITNVTFCETDLEGKILTEEGSTLYSDLMFLQPIITYDVLTKGQEIEIWYKLYSPDGVLMTSNESKKGFTWKGVLKRIKDQEKMSMGGYGNINKNLFTAGVWNIEFYDDNVCLNKSSITIHER